MNDEDRMRWWSWDLRRGALAGACAGLVSVLWNLIVAAYAGGRLWVPLKAAAYPILGEPAVAPGFAAGAVALGVALHLATATAWGSSLALVLQPFPRAFYVPLGAMWGLVAWLGMSHVVVPLVTDARLAAALAPGDVVIAHLLFGVSLGIAYALLDVRSDRERTSVRDVPAALAPPR